MSQTPQATPDVPAHVAETLEAIADLHKRAERDIPRHQRSIEAWSAMLAHSLTVFVVAGGILVWCVLNAILSHLRMSPPDPPPFFGLQVTCSAGALLVATMVWATQNRQRKAADDRERLDLQISMLTEQKLTKVIALVEELRRDMPNVVNRVDPLADAMTQAIDPHAVADALKHTLEASADCTSEVSET